MVSWGTRSGNVGWVWKAYSAPWCESRGNPTVFHTDHVFVLFTITKKGQFKASEEEHTLAVRWPKFRFGRNVWHCARTQAGLAAGCSMLIHIHSDKKQSSQTICFGLDFGETCSTTTQRYAHLVVGFHSQCCIPISAMRWESRLPNTRRGCQASSNLSMNAAARDPNISHFSLSARMIMLAQACERDEIPFPFKILQKCNLVPEIRLFEVTVEEEEH